MLIHKFGSVVELTAPHDILTKRIGEYLPQDAVLREMMETSYRILSNHPLNLERKAKAQSCQFRMVLGGRHQADADLL